MKIFVSWSGALSHKVALALSSWLPNVIQAAKPYVSSEDITKGKRWPNELGERLEKLDYGIICLTPDNLTAPWIHFEAGALSKSLEESVVAPFLFKTKKADVDWPLAQFQLTSYERNDVLKMMKAINSLVSEPLDAQRLTTSFDRFWPDLEKDLTPLLNERVDATSSQDVPHRSDSAILEELLDLVRGQHRMLNDATGDRFFTFRGNARIDPLSPGDYRQLAMGLAMLKTLADIERLDSHKPNGATIRTLLKLRDPLEVLLARAHAPRIHSVYFVEEAGQLMVQFEERSEDEGNLKVQETLD